MNQPILNLSSYAFMPFTDDERAALKPIFLKACALREIKGTIILSPEGANFNLAGLESHVRDFCQWLALQERFSAIVFKESFSETIPFGKMVVKLRKMVIPGWEGTDPNEGVAPAISPAVFKEWLDTQKDVVVLDTRNRYETKMGLFENAIDLEIDEFNQFDDAARKKLDPALKEKPLVMYCTGGVRCEKAAKALINQGFEEVYQLEGGILKYFEECGGAHYQGNCFVYDNRVALTPELKSIGES